MNDEMIAGMKDPPAHEDGRKAAGLKMRAGLSKDYIRVNQNSHFLM